MIEIHLIVDNHSTHKHPAPKNWLGRHKRFHVHFTPTSASWINKVEGFFRDLTDKCIRRDEFISVDDFVGEIEHYIAKHNEAPIDFIWTAKAEDILQKVARARKNPDKLQTT